MTDSSLLDLWTEYKKIETGHKRTKRALELEDLIHARQKSIGSSAYDFDSRWDKKEKMGKPTVVLPTNLNMREESPSVPQSSFTVEQARDIIKKNDCAILDDCAKWADVRMVYLAYVLDKINPKANENVARRGQATNLAIAEFNRRKKDG